MWCEEAHFKHSVITSGSRGVQGQSGAKLHFTVFETTLTDSIFLSYHVHLKYTFLGSFF